MKSIRDLKRAAKAALKGNYGVLIMASIATAALTFLGNILTTTFFPEDSVLSMILSQIFSIILSLVFSVVTAGVSYMLLKVAREGSCAFGELFYFFRSHPDRVIIASTVLAVIDVVAMLPATYYSFAAEVGTTLEAQMEWLTTYSLIVLVTTVVRMLIGIPFAMIYFLLADNEEMGGIEAVKTSARMMKGKIGKYLLLQLSFFPLLILSLFTLYIALLWVVPYMQMSSAMFYRDLIGELDAPVQNTEFYTMTDHSQTPEIPGDDYNSEA